MKTGQGHCLTFTIPTTLLQRSKKLSAAAAALVVAGSAAAAIAVAVAAEVAVVVAVATMGVAAVAVALAVAVAVAVTVAVVVAWWVLVPIIETAIVGNVIVAATMIRATAEVPAAGVAAIMIISKRTLFIKLESLLPVSYCGNLMLEYRPMKGSLEPTKERKMGGGN